MKRLVGVFVLVAALAGPMAVKTESRSTAQVTTLNATLSPAYVVAGAQVTVRSVESCPLVSSGQPMRVFWSLGPGALAGNVTTGTDGSWLVQFAAPTAAGVSPFFAHCALSAESNAIAMYKQLSFTVVARVPPRYTG